MTATNHSEGRGLTRRRVLQATGGAVGVVGLGSADAAASDDAADGDPCPDATVAPSTVPYDDSLHEVCTDDAPASQALQADVRRSLESTYPTVGALIDAGFVPYFDFFTEGTVSHWISPKALGDDSVLDPARPESILVDHTWWRPIGVMFVATEGGERVDPPPTVYADENDGGACTPWHAHVGLAGRYAWWKYRLVYEDGEEFPCRTPWMMHVWRYDSRESVYAHRAPTDRGGPPAEPPGFDTDADPDEVTLGPEHLPDALLHLIEDLWDRSA